MAIPKMSARFFLKSFLKQFEQSFNHLLLRDILDVWSEARPCQDQANNLLYVGRFLDPDDFNDIEFNFENEIIKAAS